MKSDEAKEKYFSHVEIGSNTFDEIFKYGIKEGKRREKTRIKKLNRKPIAKTPELK